MQEEAIEKINLIQELLSNVDILIALGIVAGAFVFVYTIGKDYVVTSIFSLYMALGTMILVPALSDLSFGFPDHVNKIIIFAALIVIFLYLQSKNGFFEPIVVPDRWESAVFAIVWAGMTIMSIVSFLPPEMHSEISEPMRLLFLDQPFSNIWFALPIVSLLLVRGDA